MTEAAAFSATYSDWRLIKGRKVVQVIFEVPLEHANKVFDVLGGMPDPASSVWCGIARLSSEPRAREEDGKQQLATAPGLENVPTDRARKLWHELSPAQQAGVLCADPIFQRFIRETENDAFVTSNGDYAAAVRYLCDVSSRRDITPGTRSKVLWDELVWHYRAWSRATE